MMALMAAAAAVTERVRIVPTLYVLPMHPAIHVAKHAATLDLISGGRTTITVGIGGRMHDYQCMEKDPVRSIFGNGHSQTAFEIAIKIIRQVRTGYLLAI